MHDASTYHVYYFPLCKWLVNKKEKFGLATKRLIMIPKVATRGCFSFGCFLFSNQPFAKGKDMVNKHPRVQLLGITVKSVARNAAFELQQEAGKGIRVNYQMHRNSPGVYLTNSQS